MERDPECVREVVCDIVDYLQPLISPYELGIYWYMFRNSVLANGDPTVVVSASRIARNTGIKFRDPKLAGKLPSDRTISENLRQLESRGAIKRLGETGRNGTPYKVFVPREIPACIERIRSMQALQEQAEASLPDIDYYNVPENRIKVFERDNYVCYKCGKLLTRKTATLDHILPVSDGGEHEFENLVTCCILCNSKRRNSPIGDFLDKD